MERGSKHWVLDTYKLSWLSSCFAFMFVIASEGVLSCELSIWVSSVFFSKLTMQLSNVFVSKSTMQLSSVFFSKSIMQLLTLVCIWLCKVVVWSSTLVGALEGVMNFPLFARWSIFAMSPTFALYLKTLFYNDKAQVRIWAPNPIATPRQSVDC